MRVYFFGSNPLFYKNIKKEVNIFLKEMCNLFKVDSDIKIFFHNSREEFNKNFGSKTEKWMVGFSNKNEIHLISPNFINKLSIHKMHKKWYLSLVKHEIVHCFYNFYENRNGKFDEVIAMWLSRNFLVKEIRGIKLNEIDEFLNFPQDYKTASILALFLYYLEKNGFDKKELLLDVSEGLINKKYGFKWGDFIKFREKSILYI